MEVGTEVGIHDLVQLTTGRVYAEFLTSAVAEVWGGKWWMVVGWLVGCFRYLKFGDLG